ncbi:hypothetical protein SAMN04488243_1036 [Thermus arciformis]|uniref:Lipopolysaccharide export system protein LptA n=1 Tax=Thermus arciformis TaxID=482827 RepID=A0A1G7DIY4_9DEIN|nr:hypothetical protein [Thermus arciformis]SDE51469.1 hypothetical protein SAMN04488243_1036 [Thermus arciformis]
MPWPRLPLLFLLGLALALAQEVYRPEVELVRKDKKVVAWVSGEEGSLFYADYGDLHVGELVALTGDRAVVGERAFFLDAGSVLEEGLSPGDRVEAAYNKDLLREGLPYLMRLRRAGEEGAKTYLRLVLYDPKGVEVRLGEEVEARGPLALVERGGREELLLSGGEARFLEEEGRLELRPALGEVLLVQGEVGVKGSRLRYRNDRGEAFLEGPLEVERRGEKPLRGKAGGLRYLLDEDALWLIGGVELVQGGRTTRAERALLREKEGYAYLYGGVESRDEKGFVRGERVRYALKTGEVLVLGQVAGEFKE